MAVSTGVFVAQIGIAVDVSETRVFVAVGFSFVAVTSGFILEFENSSSVEGLQANRTKMMITIDTNLFMAILLYP